MAVPDPNGPVVVSSVVSVTCTGGNDGEINLTVPSGNNYTYLWSNGSTTQNIGNLTAGLYDVTVTDPSSGCKTVLTGIQVTVINQIIAVAVQDAPVRCNGESNGVATINANGGTLPYTYTWDKSNSTSATATDLPAGINTYKVFDSGGCTITETVLITEPDILKVVITAVTDVSCNGESDGSATLSGTGGNGNYTYIWANGETSATANSLESGITSFTVTDSKGCTYVDFVTIMEPALLLASAVIDSDVSCNGLSDGVATITPNGGTPPYTYVWGATVGPATNTNLPAGNNAYAVIDANGCLATGNLFVGEPAVLTSNVINIQGTYCNNDGTAEVEAIGGTSPYTYLWDSGETTAIATQLSVGVHSVTVTDDNGCSLIVDNIQINSNSPTTSISSQHPLCFGSSNGRATVFVSNALPPITYVWNTVPQQTNSIATGLSAGIYSVTVTDSNNCSLIETIQIDDPPAVLVDLGPDSTSCTPPNTILEVMDPNVIVEWSTGVMGSTILISEYGSYQVTVTDMNGCTGTDEIEFSDTGFTPGIMSDTSLILGNTIELFASGGDTYMWWPDEDLSCTFCPDPIASPNTHTDYFVEITSNDGCVDTLQVNVSVELSDGETIAVTELITPNNDSKNDKFFVFVVNEENEDAIVKIFNRSGAQVYEGLAGERDNFWDGTYKNQGDPLPDGVYWYLIEDNDTILKRGAVTMIGSGN